MGMKMIRVDCPYCTNGILIETDGQETPEQLSEKAALACNCEGSWGFRHERKIRARLVDDLEDTKAVDAVMEMVSLVKSGYYDVVTVKKDEITYQIKTNADNVLKFQRKKNEKEDMTL